MAKYVDLVPAPVIEAKWGTTPLLVLLLVLLAAAVLWCVYLTVRERDLVPALVCAGGAIAVFNEPLWDFMGQIVYAQNQPILYTSFGGRGIPVFLLSGYVVWVATVGLGYSRLMARGVAPRTLYTLAAASFLSVVLVEIIGNSSDMWHYYGESPAKYLVVAPQMAPVPLVCGFMIHHLRRQARGLGLVGFVAIPGMALAGVFAATSWPVYYVLNSDHPAVWNWVAALSLLGMCAGTVRVIGGCFAETPADELISERTHTNGGQRVIPDSYRHSNDGAPHTDAVRSHG